MPTVNCPALIDNYIAQSTPATNYGGSTPIVVGVDGNTRRILMKFDLSAIPLGSEVTTANIHFYLESRGYGSNSEVLSQILADWDEGNSTYNNRLAATPWNTAGCAGIGTDYTTTNEVGFSVDVVGWYSVSMLNIATQWIKWSANNYGVRFSNTNSRWANITARSGGNVPYLEVSYTAPGVLTCSFTISRLYRTDGYGSKTTLFNFTDTSIGIPLTWNWERRRSDVVGDPWVSFSVIQNPTAVTFPNVGDWDIRLTVTNAGSSDSHEEPRLMHVWFPFTQTFTSGTDTYLNVVNPNTNYSTVNPNIGDYAPATERRVLINIDISAAPVGHRVDSVLWNHYGGNNSGYSPGGEQNPYIGRVLKNVVHSQATWNEYSTGNIWDSSGCKAVTDFTGGRHSGLSYWQAPGSTAKSANITDYCIQWAEAGQPNYGFVVYGITGWDSFRIDSMEAASANRSKFAYSYLLEPLPPVVDFTVNQFYGPRNVAWFTFTDLTDTTLYYEETFLWEYRKVGTVPWVTFSIVKAPPALTLTERGDYDIRFTVTNESGSDMETKLNYIHVWTGKVDVICPDAADSYMNKDNHDTNYGSAATMNWGWSAPYHRPLIKFNLSGLPVGCSARAAIIYWYVESSFGGGGGVFYRCLRDWVETQVTFHSWKTGSLWTLEGASSDGNDFTSVGGAGAYIAGTGWKTFDLTAITQAWLAGSPNYGVCTNITWT